jgi:hypothetical protein
MAGKTPHGARPNRETTFADARVLRAGVDERTARPTFPGRSLDPVSNAGTRGMIVAPTRARKRERRRTEFGLRQTAALFYVSLFTFYFLRFTFYVSLSTFNFLFSTY